MAGAVLVLEARGLGALSCVPRQHFPLSHQRIRLHGVVNSPAPGGPIRIMRTPSCAWAEMPWPPPSRCSSSAMRASSVVTLCLRSSTEASCIGAIVLTAVGTGGRSEARDVSAGGDGRWVRWQWRGIEMQMLADGAPAERLHGPPDSLPLATRVVRLCLGQAFGPRRDHLHTRLPSVYVTRRARPKLCSVANGLSILFAPLSIL